MKAEFEIFLGVHVNLVTWYQHLRGFGITNFFQILLQIYVVSFFCSLPLFELNSKHLMHLEIHISPGLGVKDLTVLAILFLDFFFHPALPPKLYVYWPIYCKIFHTQSEREKL